MRFHSGKHFESEHSPIHHIDPRVKVVATLLFIVGVNLISVGNWWFFAALQLFLFVVFWTAKLPVGSIWLRSLAAVPFVLAAVAVIFTTSGKALVTIPVVGWEITLEGIVYFLSILFRFWLAVQMAVVLSAVTPASQILWALHALHLPPVLVSIIGFMHRYLFVVGDEAIRMLRSRNSRSVRLPLAKRVSFVWQIKIAGRMVGSLFLRALDRAERIHAAMLSRGYDGTPRALLSFQMKIRDWVVLVFMVSVVVTIGITEIRW